MNQGQYEELVTKLINFKKYNLIEIEITIMN
jgi:hypothetical protein